MNRQGSETEQAECLAVGEAFARAASLMIIHLSLLVLAIQHRPLTTCWVNNITCIRSNSCLELRPRCLHDHCFRKQHGHMLWLHCSGTWTARGLVYKEVCSHAGVDWLKPTCQSEGGERSIYSLTLITATHNTKSMNLGDYH